MEIGVDTLPKLPMDAGDRNRTSPFAFTGNRFEFRAVGGGQSIGGPLIALCTAVAESVDFVATKLEAAVGAGKPLNGAIQSVLAEIMKENGAVVFNGDGYSSEWHAEAEKRGLLNLKTTPDALKILELPETVKLFEKYNVLSARELHSRYEIYLEQYVKTVQVEAKLTIKIAMTQILPAAVKYLSELGESFAAAKAFGVSGGLKLPGKIAKLTSKRTSRHWKRRSRIMAPRTPSQRPSTSAAKCSRPC
jgi:glutamine synthetase